MNLAPSHKRVFLSATVVLAMSSLRLHASEDMADGHAVRLEEIEVKTSAVSALTQAPTDSKLEALQPQSIIGIDYISNNVAPTADFATIANIAPSVSNVETNGPGLSESKHLTMRGFDDAQYNVTFDGIPFGDINDFSHHTTSYFPAKLLGKVVVDRGPGTASTIGEATFGGTLAMFSKDPRSEMSVVPTLSLGSWNTRLAHLEVNSGLLSPANNASVIASYQRMTTDGYRTNSDMKRDTFYAKYIQPVGKSATLTFLGSYNKIHFSNPSTVTRAQIATNGRNYGLGSNPNNTDYTGYNFQDKVADFEYLGLEASFATNWSVSDKLYTYSYDNQSREKPKAKVVGGITNFIGAYKVNRFRTFGNYLLLAREDSYGTFHIGAWVDYSRNPRFLYGLNYTATGDTAIDVNPATNQFGVVASNPVTAVGAEGYNYSYKMVDWLKTFQPFAEYEWRATSSLTINPGVKYVNLTRDIEAPINGSKARKPLFYSHTETSVLPYLAANYRLDPSWSLYAQAAKGLLASNLNQFYVDVPTSNTVKPGETMNYQAGTVFRQDRFNASADIYYIDFKNYAYKGPVNSSGDPAYYGVARGAYYSGAEIEATYFVGGGLSLYGNGSINRAEFKGSRMDVPTVPYRTAALGIVYRRTGFFGSLTEKYVDRATVYDTITNPDIAGGGASRQSQSAAYWLGDLSVGYGRKLEHSWLRSFKIRFQVSNVFNQKVQVLDEIDPNPANAYAKDKFNVLPVRNYFLTLSGEF